MINFIIEFFVCVWRLKTIPLGHQIEDTHYVCQNILIFLSIEMDLLLIVELLPVVWQWDDTSSDLPQEQDGLSRDDGVEGGQAVSLFDGIPVRI